MHTPTSDFGLVLEKIFLFHFISIFFPLVMNVALLLCIHHYLFCYFIYKYSSVEAQKRLDDKHSQAEGALIKKNELKLYSEKLLTSCKLVSYKSNNGLLHFKLSHVKISHESDLDVCQHTNYFLRRLLCERCVYRELVSRLRRVTFHRERAFDNLRKIY